MRYTFVCACVFLGLLPLVIAGETIKCPATADAWISSCGKECDTNMGKAPRLKQKGYQEFCLLDFDVSALKGKNITGATLFVAPAEGRQHAPPERGTDLRWFTLSTVSSPWKEGDGTNYTIDGDGEGATFNEASFGKTPWAYPGSKVYDVTLGNGNTLRTDVDAGDPKDGWMAVPVDKKLVQALAAKASHGLLLMDGSVFTSANAFIHSRESDKAPYLVVNVDGEKKGEPAAPANLVVASAPLDAGLRTGSLSVSLTVPEGAFAYDVKIDGKPAPRWQVPFAGKPGSTQTFVIEFLEPDREVTVELAAVDAAGAASKAASATGKTCGTVAAPRMPGLGWVPAGSAPPALAGKLKVWAFPEISKLDPLTGDITLEDNMELASARNSVWDASSSTVRLVVARGEIAGLQLALDAAGPVSGIKVGVEGLAGVTPRLFRTWFVKVKDAWQADYVIPLKEGEALAIPAADNGIAGQKAAVVGIDLIVAPDAKPGEQTGAIKVALDGAGELKLNLKLLVCKAVIPAELNFLPELNCYRGPLGDAGTEKFFNAFRLAHYYRCTPNRVPHSHNGRTNADWIPQVGPDGHVTDWTNFDKNLGPLFDGSAFKDCPRAGVPVPALYLPFNESWPLPIGPHYKPGDNVPLEGKDWKPKHDLLAKAPEDAFDQGYKTAFATCVADFVKHFEEKGWNRTLMECYNNNKVQYGKRPLLGPDGKPVLKDGKPEMIPGMTGTAWTLDEPATWLDWQALLFYSKLFHQGLGGAKTVKFVYRGDISRPHWQGSCFDGYMEVMIAGGAAYQMLPLMKNAMRRMPTKVITYGGCNNQDRANHATTAWVLKSYCNGFDGVMPWQSIGGDEALDKGDFVGKNGAAENGNMLIVDGSKRFGVDAIASLRLQAFRSGAQIAELLRLLEAKRNWARTHSLALVSQLVPLGAEFKQAFADDAAALKFDDLNGDQFVRVKEGVLKLLEE